jgi:hypothetical protein
MAGRLTQEMAIPHGGAEEGHKYDEVVLSYFSISSTG